MIASACEIDTSLSSLEDQLDFRAFLLNNVGLGRSSTPVKMALFLDEVEGLLGSDFSDEFLMTLRDLYQHRDSYPGQLLIAFAGSVDPETLVKDPTISPFNVAEEIPLDDFTAAESLTLTSNLIKTGIPVAETVHGRIYEWTAGQPHLTQRICEIIEGWVEAARITDISTDVVDRVVLTGLLSPLNRDKNIKHVLGEIANLEPLPAELWRRLIAGEPVYSTEAGFYALYLTGAVTETPDGRVKIRNRIYERALAEVEVPLGAEPAETAQPREELRYDVSMDPDGLKVGLQRVNERIAASPSGTRSDFAGLEARLLGLLTEEERDGPSEALRSARARVMHDLNRFCLKQLGKTFNEYCS